jgi:hypothetical protein
VEESKRVADLEAEQKRLEAAKKAVEERLQSEARGAQVQLAATNRELQQRQGDAEALRGLLERLEILIDELHGALQCAQSEHRRPSVD